LRDNRFGQQFLAAIKSFMEKRNIGKPANNPSAQKNANNEESDETSASPFFVKRKASTQNLSADNFGEFSNLESFIY
jgi:hypothetical protein